MNGRFLHSHPRQRIGANANHRQQNVDAQQTLGDVQRARQRLAKRVKPFRLEELHPADLHHRQENHRHDHNAPYSNGTFWP